MDELMVIDRIPQGTVTPPPSKSISHRALICAALSNGTSKIGNIQFSEDVQATLNCIQALGIKVEFDGKILIVRGGQNKSQADAVLDCGESGSTLRFFLPIALLYSQPVQFTGHGRLLQRPLKEYKKALEENGAQITLNDELITVQGPIRPGIYRMSGSVSSQYVSGLLFALPMLDGDSEIILTSPLESKAYVDLTVSVMEHFGVKIVNNNYERFIIRGNQTFNPCDFTIETDYSAAAFFLAAGALGCDVECFGLNLDSLQGDRQYIDILQQCGIKIDQSSGGGLKALKGKIQPVTVDVKDIPDLVPPLTSVLCFCEGESKIINAGRLRLKESDRLHALAEEFNNLGADIIEGEDSLIIRGVKNLHGGIADAHNDHRIAMAIAVASIKSNDQIQLKGADSVKKSYPDFWKDFCRIERSQNHE